MEESNNSKRKNEHLEIFRTKDTQSQSSAGWEFIRLPHRALPEINFSDITLETEFLGQKYSAPFLISSMTGGTAEGDRINRELARFAEKAKIPMGIGSQRTMLENRHKACFEWRRGAPKAHLYANIGAVQLNYGVTLEDCLWLIESIEASAFILHLNPLQEAIQVEGNRNFSGLLSKISELKKSLPVPLIVKETGCGLDSESCKKLLEAGADALDIAGLGGTHWGYIEGLRHKERRKLGKLFREWGIPSSEALIEARKILGPSFPLIASGGIKNGLEAAKALSLGANFVGLANAFLKKLFVGESSLDEFFNTQCEALKMALFCMGAKTIKEIPRL